MGQLEIGVNQPVPWARRAEADTDYWSADKQVMINLRVSDLDELIASLRVAGVQAETRAEWDSPETGMFARIHDPEGNAIELWEPPAG